MQSGGKPASRAATEARKGSTSSRSTRFSMRFDASPSAAAPLRGQSGRAEIDTCRTTWASDKLRQRPAKHCALGCLNLRLLDPESLKPSKAGPFDPQSSISQARSWRQLGADFTGPLLLSHNHRWLGCRCYVRANRTKQLLPASEQDHEPRSPGTDTRRFGRVSSCAFVCIWAGKIRSSAAPLCHLRLPTRRSACMPGRDRHLQSVGH